MYLGNSYSFFSEICDEVHALGFIKNTDDLRRMGYEILEKIISYRVGYPIIYDIILCVLRLLEMSYMNEEYDEEMYGLIIDDFERKWGLL